MLINKLIRLHLGKFQYKSLIKHPCSLRSLQKRFNSNLEKYNLNLVIRGVPLHNYIKNLEETQDVSKDNSAINNQAAISLLTQRKKTVDELINLEELYKESGDNKDLEKLIEEEKNEFENRMKFLDEEILRALLPVDENDDCQSLVLEINAGVGGQEAMLFAGELLEMYQKFSENQGWAVQIAEYGSTDIGGIRHGTLLINGAGVYKYLKHEGGVHRVQRIPATEKAGRIHTSTVSVVALPEPSDIDVKIDNKDIKLETKRASGAGGQHVNTTDSAVRITHLPSGISVECQVDRSQLKNKEMAFTKLRALLYKREMDRQLEKADALRKGQVRSNFRNEKIRTYNFPQDRITDHRLQGGTVHNIKGFFMGNESLKLLIDKLDFEMRIETLLECVNSFEINNRKY